MSSSFFDRLPQLVIGNGTNASNEIWLGQYEDAYLVGLAAPTSLGADAGHVLTIQVAMEKGEFETPTWKDLYNSADIIVTAPGENRAKVYAELQAFGRFRIKSNNNVTADRIWQASKSHPL